MDQGSFSSWARAAQVLHSAPSYDVVSSFSPETEKAMYRIITRRLSRPAFYQERGRFTASTTTQVHWRHTFYGGFVTVCKDSDAVDAHDVESALDTLSVQGPRIYTPLSSEDSPEEEWRKRYRGGVDDIIKYAFSVKEDHTCATIFDAAVRLRVPIPPPKGFNPNTVADVLVTTSPKSIKPRGPSPNEYYWQGLPDLGVSVSLIGFAVQYEVFDARSGSDNRWLLAILATAQSQRRALGLPDRMIYGASVSSGRCWIYASCWSKVNRIDRILVGNMQHLLLLWQPYDIVRWYVFLSKVHTTIKEMEVEFDQYAATGKLGGTVAWRAPDVK
ncbi:hypothetical protein BOTBODRAFT_192750 [Botryobasidium botryosum FD-172 SS1]|uniref:Uncharacterized protein n=1 Tax=Botryobasidium botryosum (strain FD-172 SS1) TaxID=930990 RepID=A0A067LX80_BOTB1|nr:hypothetical protein BOTBODRAFT_192750 [Botryobasidium botryosum FD-172 SS1]